MKKTKSDNQRAWLIIYFTLIFSFIYAISRYHIAGDVPWKDLPFYVSNKAFAMASLVILSINFSLSPIRKLGIRISDNWLESKRMLGFVGFIIAMVHVFMSLLLFKPSVYSKFFGADSTMTFMAGLSMLGGVLSFVLLWMYNVSFNANFRNEKTFLKIITSRSLILVALFFVGLHLFTMGLEGWLNPTAWQGGLPPISLVSFTILLVGFIVNIFGRK